MNREYRDLSVNEPDGRLYYDLVDRSGKTVLTGVNPRLVSPVLQKGDRWSAAAANKLLRLSENGAPVLAIPPKEVGGLCRCTHQKTGAVHALSGDGSDLRFVAAADFAAGDTFTFNGAAVSARTLAGEELWPGYFKTGSVVLCHVNGSTLTFSGGGGLGSADKETVKAFLAVGHSVLGGQVQGSYTADASARADQLNEGATAYVNGQKLTGTVPMAKGGWLGEKIWRETSYIEFRPGQVFMQADDLNYHKTGVAFVGKAVPELLEENIRKGVKIGSVAGSFVGETQYQATAVSHQDYDPDDWTKSHLAQDTPEILQDITPEQSKGYAIFRFVRDAKVRIRTMSFGNNGSAGHCSLADGWHWVQRGEEMVVYARVAAHGSGLYRNTVVNLSY